LVLHCVHRRNVYMLQGMWQRGRELEVRPEYGVNRREFEREQQVCAIIRD
jgi:hypothetical protein